MDYLIYFDIVALFNFTISIFLYKQHRNLPIAQNRIFLWLNIFGYIATAFDILATKFLEQKYNVPVSLCYFANCSALMCLNSLPVLYCIYIYQYTRRPFAINATKRLLFRFLIIIPYMIEIILIALSPIVANKYNLVFKIDENRIYYRGTIGMGYTYVCMFIYLIHAGIYLITGRKQLPPKKFVYIWSYVFFELIAILIQAFIPKLLVINYGVSVTALFLCCFVHTPEDVADGVTGLFNQNTFIYYCDSLLIRKQNITCLNITINNIDNIINSFGISNFNICLKNISNYLSKVMKKGGGFYLGKGQFCFVFKNNKNVNIDSIISEIQNRFYHPWEINSVNYKLNPTLCVIDCPSDSNNPSDIINDITYVAEEIGYSKNVIYAKNIDTNEKKRMVYIEHAILKGIEKRRFQVYYQPIYSVEKRRIIGAEITSRLKDSKGRILYPEEFMEIAEKTGTILSIGDITLGNLCKTLQKRNASLSGIQKININLSVSQYMQENLVSQLLLMRVKYDIPTSLINLEITETAASQKIENLIQDMELLSREGFELILDNFGAGYSNFDYLLKLPFRTVKIDKSIINSASKDIRANKALETVITMIHRLGMSVMADGIQTKEQADWLIKSGCDYIQGSYFSDPLTEDDFFMIMKKINENALL